MSYLHLMLEEHPDVKSVFLTGKCTPQTTNSWIFLGLGKKDNVLEASLWRKTFGEDIIIANIDSGVLPESKSFSDEDMGPIPTRWRGICQTGKDNSDNFHCNRLELSKRAALPYFGPVRSGFVGPG
ncbi:subtilisin-like protease SBT5.3 [Trifolium pratense]|uniref:subtilisin-like protease SBT5.3 n=1 Tax=Trifolium pratense TaxID=57577 RepID=UPI001E69066D|nr:subtilisin-like protease SBT5.3 [Trifolium pratense]